MYIVKNQVNTVSLTLTEKATTDDPEWIIKFTNDTTGLSKVVAVTDISDFQERSNIFLIEENDTEDLSSGVVSLSPSGQWTYTAYEMERSSPRSLDTDDALAEVETDMCKVYDATEGLTESFDEDDEINNPVFEG